MRVMTCPSQRWKYGLVQIFSLVLALASPEVLARETCHPSSIPPLRLCEAAIDPSKLTEVVAAERQSAGGWAASLEMVFRYHGHPVAQQTLAKSLTGVPIGDPAVSASVITTALNREWVDDNGRALRTRAVAFDAESGSFGVKNEDIVRELREDHPLLVATITHAMLITAIQYLSPPNGGVSQLTGVTVHDPWPGEGRRQLHLDELLPRYAMSVRVEELERSPVVSAAAHQAGCASDADCKGGRTCDSGRCVGAAARSCAKDTDCPGTQICSTSGFCAVPADVQSSVWRAPEKAPTSDNREGCLKRCAVTAAGCENDLMSVDLCLQTRTDSCVRVCAMNTSYSEGQCRTQLCTAGVAENAGWESKCQSQFHEDQQSCRNEQATCQKGCQ
jgi:hypothetical protein